MTIWYKMRSNLDIKNTMKLEEKLVESLKYTLNPYQI